MYLFCKLLTTFVMVAVCNCKVARPKVDKPLSPLDGAESRNDDQDTVFIPHNEFAEELPPCQSACVKPALQVLTIYFKTGSFTENMRQACRAYDEATRCMRRHSHCGPDSMFESLTSGLRYMCLQQKEAFNALADCIDANSGRVSQDCDQQCHPNSLATGIALKDTVMNQLEHPLVSKNVNMRRIIEPHMSRFFFSQGCRIAQCLMGCTKTKYNMLCEGTAGSLLLEMLTRPLSSREMSSVSFPSTTYLASVLGGLLPHQCAFLTARDGGRGSFRIDPELDKEIKRMYADKDRTKGVPLPSPLSQPVDVANPFLEMSNVFHRSSPIDDGEADGALLGSGDFPQELCHQCRERRGNPEREEEERKAAKALKKGEQFTESSGETVLAFHRAPDGDEVMNSQRSFESSGEEVLDEEGSGVLPELYVAAGQEYTIRIPSRPDAPTGELVCFVREEGV